MLDGAALFTAAKTWTQPKCPSVDEWMKKTWYIYTTKYYSPVRKKERLPLATTGLELESTVLRRARQRKTDTARSHLHVESKIKESSSLKQRVQKVVARGCGVEEVGRDW